MNRDCEEGLKLRKLFEAELRRWGWFDACAKAVEMMPLGLPEIMEFHKEAKLAESALAKARYAYADHMAFCVVCSRKLVAVDAIPMIHDRLKNDGIPR